MLHNAAFPRTSLRAWLTMRPDSARSERDFKRVAVLRPVDTEEGMRQFALEGPSSRSDPLEGRSSDEAACRPAAGEYPPVCSARLRSCHGVCRSECDGDSSARTIARHGETSRSTAIQAKPALHTHAASSCRS
jgi:hypothetical protein